MPQIKLTDTAIIYSEGQLEDCILPYREAMRTNLKRTGGWWSRWYGNGPRVESANVWQFRDRIIISNIGKNHDLAFSHYVSKTKHIGQNIQYWFEKFNERREYYVIDEDGNIQKGYVLKRRDDYRLKMAKTRVDFKSADYYEAYVHINTGEVKDTLQWLDKEHEWQLSVISGRVDPNVHRLSKKYRRLRYEYNQKAKQLEKERKKALKEKAYSLLTLDEQMLKALASDDLWKIESHGFNSESFKGEGYHGRQNKNKNKK